jgi:6-pyruvoyltetrahydropterin/6-carboxytetrahydropterin synthase
VITATRRIQFCAGHRVVGHESRCAHLHGHNYVALVTASAEQLDGVGRVIDFSVLKESVGSWIEEYWDHGFVLWIEDGPGQAAMASMRLDGIPQKEYIMPSNPTAENMARFLLFSIGPRVLDGTGVRLTKVVLWETENCFAEATL